MDKLFLIDAYALIFRSYYAMIRAPRINSKGFNTSAVLGFVNTLEEILLKEKPTHLGIAFDPKGGSFRNQLFTEYKAQRQETPEDIILSVPVIKEIIRAYNIPILEVEGFEADDVIGTLSKKADEKGIQTYMMTPDKDYCQLVTENVKLYKPKFGDKGYDVLGPSEVIAKYGISSTAQVIDLLGLMGDSADNIPGCPGIGEKTAVKLLTEFGSIDGIIENRDSLKGALKDKVENGIEKMKFSRLLATIRTDVPIDLDMQSLEISTPNEDELTRLFDELEFRNFMKRFRANHGLPEKQTSSVGTGQSKSNTALSQKNNSNSGMGDLFGTTGSTAEGQGNEPDLFSSFGPLFAEIPGAGQEKAENQNLSGVNSCDKEYYLIDKEDDISPLLERLLTADQFAFNVIADNASPIMAKPDGIAFSLTKNQSYYVKLISGATDSNLSRTLFDDDNSKSDLKGVDFMRFADLFRPVFENSNITKIGQNLKFDILVLKSMGIEVEGPLFDVRIAHYILQPDLHHDIDFLADAYLHYSTIFTEETKKCISPESGPTYIYACQTADVCLQLKSVLETNLESDATLPLFTDVEMPLVQVLAYMEWNGARIDTKSLKETSDLFSDRMRNIEKHIFELSGMEFNILSPKQVGDVLFEKMRIVEKPKKTKTGQYVTSEEVLMALKDKSPVVDLILQYRGLKKLLGTYVNALPELINRKTGKIHTSFNQTVTVTGRLSSSNPNLQNIPIRDDDGKEVRKAFIPDNGCKFFSADYSQIELRIMAHLSHDEIMIDDFNNDHDIHTATAAKVFHKDIADVTKTERSRAKTANFGIIYGISAFGLAERMGISRTEAKEIIESYFETYKGIKSYIEKSIQSAKENGYVETIMHRKRYLPDINSANATVRSFAERNAVNAPIQGSAADIIKIAMVRIYKRFKKENIKSTMILQVHDELNFNVVPGEESIVEQIVLTEMNNAWSMSVPLIADCGWGTNWLEAH